ncbi:hypothetical protein [Mucilaginibacter gilvus]|uniref:Uncharacterized protein n=1 Tax=Mucilaginibacter gilvus TaxID=2305909 RepID=A0A3S3Z5Y5_9SPHI|nr:hypothetical protein [Mucilaginibacter gilvus]RWY53950.1 hypothetical protein EPL05_07795 [Mucilaginibacter gilvus]
MDFGLVWYFLFLKKKSAIDIYFFDLQQMLTMHEFNAETTTKLYRAEYKQAKAELEKEFNVALQEAKKIYDSHYDPTSENDEESHYLASYESGHDEIEQNHQIDDEQLTYRFSTMADYFNKSSLVITYAMFENQLRRYCDLLRLIFGKRLSVEDLDDRNYVKTCLNYLEKVIEVDIKSLEYLETKFKDLQYLRNRIMHNGGEFHEGKNEDLERIINASNGSLELIKSQEPYEEFKEDVENKLPKLNLLRVKKNEYLHQYFGIIAVFFQELLWLTDAKLKYKILKQRLLFLLGFSSKRLKIIDIKVVHIAKGRQVKASLFSDDITDAIKFNCTITITRANKNQLTIINQIDGHSKLTRLVDHLNSRPEIIFDEIFQGFNLSSKSQNFNIIFY